MSDENEPTKAKVPKSTPSKEKLPTPAANSTVATTQKAATDGNTTKATATATAKQQNNEKNPINKMRVRQKNQNDTKRHEERKKQKEQQRAIEDGLQKKVNDLLATCPVGDEVQTLTRILQPHSAELCAAYQQIHFDLDQMLRSKCVYYKIFPFGSTISGLAFRDSDFDMYIEIPNINVPLSRLVYSLGASLRGCFTEIVPISRARVPIIKCRHIRTGYYCDLSFSNSLGVHNSNVIRGLINYDRRIYPLALILKYWMRCHDLSGTGNVTNYCLFLLIVFYLQSISPPMLKPFHYYQNNTKKIIVDVWWNVTFNFDLLRPNQNEQSTSQLLQGFFQFYDKFEFEKTVICILTGCAYKRGEFQNTTVPELKRYMDYVKNDPDARGGLNLKHKMCIQDPFNLAYNVGACCSITVYEKFKANIREAAKLFEIEPSAMQSAKFLLTLFNHKAIIEKIPNGRESDRAHARQLITQIGNRISGPFRVTFRPIQLELDIIRNVLKETSSPPPPQTNEGGGGGDEKGEEEEEEPMNNNALSAELLNREWRQRMLEFLKQTLTYLHMFELEEAAAAEQQGASADQNVLCFKATVKHDVYAGRKLRKKVSSKTYLKDEHDCSVQVMRKIKTKPMDGAFFIELKTNDADEVTLVMRDETLSDGNEKNKKEKMCHALFNAFLVRIQNHLRAYFLDWQRAQAAAAAAAAAVATVPSPLNVDEEQLAEETPADEDNDDDDYVDGNDYDYVNGDDDHDDHDDHDYDDDDDDGGGVLSDDNKLGISTNSGEAISIDDNVDD